MSNIIESEEQRPGRNKQTTVNKTYLNSGEYRRKFDSITDSPELNRLLYRLAKDMLLHRSGTLYEDMYWINKESVSVVASEVNSLIEEKIDYSPRTQRIVTSMPGLLTIHSHPNSLPPSIDDLNSNYRNRYGIGVIVCHDGKVFIYTAYEQIDEDYFSMRIANYKKDGYNEYEAQIKAIEYCSQRFDIVVREVTTDGT